MRCKECGQEVIYKEVWEMFDCFNNGWYPFAEEPPQGELTQLKHGTSNKYKYYVEKENDDGLWLWRMEIKKEGEDGEKTKQ